MSSPPSSIDLLLADAGWIRRLARGLVRDPHAADDLAQDAWLAALSRPPRAEEARGWFRRVLQHRARSRWRAETRRSDRERRVAAEGARKGAPAGRSALHEELADEVEALAEPFRTVLLLRYFEGLSLRAIAERTGVPVATVASRQRRGLAKLERRLDARCGGRDAWFGACLALAGGSALTPDAPWIGAGALQAKTKLLFVGALGLGGAALVLGPRLAPREPRADTELAGALATPLERAPTAASALAPPAEPARATLSSAPLAARALPPAPAPETPGPNAKAALRGTVLLATGEPAPDFEVWLSDGSQEDGLPLARSGPDGAFARTPPPETAGVLAVRSASHRTVLAARFEPGWEREHAIVVAPRLPLAGTVRGEDGQPVAGARVAVALPEGFRARFSAVMDSTDEALPSARSDDEGRFELPDAIALPGAFARVESAGWQTLETPLPERPTAGWELVLARRAERAESLHGRVLDAHGRGVEGAHVSLGFASAVSDPDGFFRVPRDAQEGFPGGARVLACKPAHLPAVWTPPAAGAWPPLLVLTLGATPLRMAGRVIDGDGRPLGGRRVLVADPTFFGRVDQHGVQVEGLLAERATEPPLDARVSDADEPWFAATSSAYCPWVETDADGRFELEGLLPRDYRLCVFDPQTLARVDAGPFAAGRRDVEIVAATPRARVAGVVTSSAGAPLPGVRVTPWCELFRSRHDCFGDVLWPARLPAVRTDEAGRFAFDALPVTGTRLSFESPDVLPLVLPLGGEPARLDRLAVALSARFHLKVRALDPQGVAAIRVLDADERELELRVFGASGVMTTGAYRLHDGESDVLSIGEEARTLFVASPAGTERRLPLSLVFGIVNEVVIR